MDTVGHSADTARLSRGREYHRSGNVRHLELELGTVGALVTGSQLEPFEVSLRWRPLSENQVAYLRGEFLEHPESLSTVLAGRQPARAVAAVLLCPEDFRDSWCTCPDRAGMCKHRVAVARAVAEKFTAEPVAFLDWRGLDTLRLVQEVAEREKQRRPGVVDLQRHAVAPQSAEGRTGDRDRRETAETRYTAAEFWGDLDRIPEWDSPDVEYGLELGDVDSRNAAVRRVSWNTVDQLHVLDELQTCYDLLTGTGNPDEPPFASEPWLSGPTGEDTTGD